MNFADYLFENIPKYDALLLEDFRPTDPWIKCYSQDHAWLVSLAQTRWLSEFSRIPSRFQRPFCPDEITFKHPLVTDKSPPENASRWKEFAVPKGNW